MSGGLTRVWSVWVDTRDSRGEVVQYVESRTRSESNAMARVNRINTHEDEFPNMVAWAEDELIRLGDDELRALNSQAKLNPANVEEIKARRANGEPVSLLAGEFGVNRKTISRIVHGGTWAA